MEGDESHVLVWVGLTEDGRNNWFPYGAVMVQDRGGTAAEGPSSSSPRPSPLLLAPDRGLAVVSCHHVRVSPARGFSISMPSIVASLVRPPFSMGSRWTNIQVRWTSETRIYGMMVKRVDVLDALCPSSPAVALLLPCSSDDLSTNAELSPIGLPVICPKMLIRLQQSVPPDVTPVRKRSAFFSSAVICLEHRSKNT
ncbi:uncharacterized protein [Triticum aestivum]|uniref:uncharacterized protein n=1 Tax=Triticum aestivum TaxID=4565 RepID=UPI001D0192BE|nr:uncharacterized protein LOC123124182 [Triticum aestivum]